jgi:hypothetical protein
MSPNKAEGLRLKTRMQRASGSIIVRNPASVFGRAKLPKTRPVWMRVSIPAFRLSSIEAEFDTWVLKSAKPQVCW